MSLKKQIEKLAPGESFITEKARTGVYVAAKRANVEVSTEDVDGKTRVTRRGEPELTLAEQVKALSSAERLALFERFELCCGMNRGECVCKPEVAVPLSDNEKVVSLLETRDEKLAALRGMIEPNSTARFLEAVDNAIESEIVETWRFTSDKPNFPDDGRVYRQQFLVSNPKKRRNVEVDEDNHERIKRVA